MRDLLDLLENIQILNEESRGLLFRAEGDRFFKGDKSNPERVLIFDKAEYYPSIPGEYETHEAMMVAFNELNRKLPKIELTNNPTKNHKAFALLKLTDEATGQPFYSARFFNKIKPKMAGAWENWQLTRIPKEYQLEKGTSLKHAYKLKPSDIFPPPASFKNISELFKAFSASPTAKPFVPGFKMLYGKNPEFPVFENAGQYMTAIRDDLGETIGPVALIQGLDMGTGVEAARVDLLGEKGSWAGSSVSFPASKTNNLIDSYIVTSTGVEVGLSSKGGKGAQASIKNLLDGINYIRTSGSPAQKSFLKTYQNQINLINEISKTSAIDFPIQYGIGKGMISDETGQAIKLLISKGDQVMKGLDKSVVKEINYLHSKRAAQKDNPGYNAGYHALAALAAMVAKDINTDEEFSKACVALLNASPIIQLHTKVVKKADDSVAVTGFTSKYPPNFQGKVELSHDKNYSATNASGRLTFLYNEKGARPKPDEIEKPEKPAVPLAKAAAKIVDKKVKRKPRPEPSSGAGRAKRKR